MNLTIDENKKDYYVDVRTTDLEEYEGFPVEEIYIHFSIRMNNSSNIYPSQISVKFKNTNNYVERNKKMLTGKDVPIDIKKVLKSKGYSIESF